MHEVDQDILFYMVRFMLRVSHHQDENKMTNYNLSMCFAPCFLRSKNEMQDIKYIGQYIRIINIILDNYKEIFKFKLDL